MWFNNWNLFCRVTPSLPHCQNRRPTDADAGQGKEFSLGKLSFLLLVSPTRLVYMPRRLVANSLWWDGPCVCACNEIPPRAAAILTAVINSKDKAVWNLAGSPLTDCSHIFPSTCFHYGWTLCFHLQPIKYEKRICTIEDSFSFCCFVWPKHFRLSNISNQQCVGIINQSIQKSTDKKADPINQPPDRSLNPPTDQPTNK